MKRTPLLILLLALFTSTTLHAYDAYIGNGIYYNFSGNEAIVTSGDYEYSGNVVIPESVTYNGRTYSVTTIDSYAFYNCSGMTSIKIPSSLKRVKIGAFYGCTSLSKIIVTDIAAWCGIIYEGNSYTRDDYPLHQAEHLYSDEYTEITDVVIPEGVTRIEPLAFRDARYITSVTIPNSVTYIGREAFRGMHILTSINIPQTITTIEPYTFQDCRALSNISIPYGVTSIGSHAFRECLALTSITIPQSVTSIGESAFKNCPCLEDFYCNAVDIPTTGNEVFTSSPINSATLHVPTASVYAYQTTEPWSGFGAILAIGSEVEPETIEIASARELVEFASRINAGEASLCAVLKADIDLSSVSRWVPIGNEGIPFKGIFDGQGHIITGFEYTATGDCNGLFGVIKNANVKNFSISGTLTSQYDWNGVVGRADGASVVSSIHSSLTINVSNCAAHTGGVVGGSTALGSQSHIHIVLVEGCEYSGTLIHHGEGDCQAGILGYTNGGGVKNCLFSGTIIGESSNYGGILGYCKNINFKGVQNCLSVGKIVTDANCTTTAAIIGNWNGNITANVKNNYYCLQGGSTTTIAIGNNTSNCEAPHAVTTEQLASGEVCYALNGDQTGINWYQTLGNDNHPVLDNSHLPVLFIGGSYVNNLQYTITFNTNGGSPIGSMTQYVGSAITPPADPTREGYTFLGWEPAIPETMPVGGLTCVAQWQVNNYTLTYLVDGVEYKTASVPYGTAITPEEAPTKEGYTFSGWSEIPEVMPAHDVVITGSFTANTYTLTYIVDGVEYKTASVTYGTAITPEAVPAKEGYTFSGWSEVPETMPAHDVVITGSFTANTYTLTYIVDGQEYRRSEVEYGATITPLEAPTKEGYTFSGWSYIPSTMPAADIVVMGTFTINSYSLTYVVDGEEYKTSTVTYGSAITPEEEPTKEGYTFSGWSEIPDTMPAGDVVVTGSFAPNGYTLLYIVDGEEYKTDSIAYGSTIIPEAEPTKEGYTFSGWNGLPETMPAEDVTVTGTFTINQYLLTYILDGEEYKSYTIDYNTALTPEPAPVKKGMTFSGWGEMPETMPAHDVTLTGAYTWSKETVDGLVYQVADTLNNYATIVGYEGTDGKAEILSDIEIGGDLYEVHSIADNALQKSITIYTSVGRLLLWLWTNGYANIRETETGNSLSAPEMSLVGVTASSLKLSFANPYPELTETVTVSGAPVEKEGNGYEIALNGLEPDNLYDGLASVALTYEDASYTKSYSFKTEPLILTALQPKVVSLGNVIVTAESNLDDDETNVGFEWRRIDWTDDFESRTGAAYLYEGIMEGYIRSLNADRLWKFRPYYTSNAGNTYYSDWKGMDPSDYSFFEPTVHTYEPIAVTDSTAEVKGYAMQGTDDVASQGFMYWQNTSPASSRMRANGAPEDATVVEVPGHVMKTTLAGLDYDTEYCFVAFVKTGNGAIFYGEQQSFRTTSDHDGIEDIKASEDVTEIARYDISGRMIGKPQKGINIIRYSDGTTRKVMVK